MLLAMKRKQLTADKVAVRNPFGIQKWFQLLLPCLMAFGISLRAEKLEIQAASVNWRGSQGNDYGIFDTVTYAYAVNFNVTRKKTAKEDTPFFVTFSKNTTGNLPRKLTSGANTLDYQLYDSLNQNNALSELPSALANQVLVGIMAPDELEKRLNYFVVIPALQIQPPGTYQDSVELTVYEGTLTDYKKNNSTAITIAAQVVRLAELSIVNSGEAFVPQSVTKELNFGVLTHGKSLGFDLRLRSNAGYTVTIESENRGYFKHTSAGDNSGIPYTFILGGILLDLSLGPVTPISKNIITSAPGDPYAGLITIGSTDNASAGNYRDTITLTVQTAN